MITEIHFNYLIYNWNPIRSLIVYFRSCDKLSVKRGEKWCKKKNRKWWGKYGIYNFTDWCMARCVGVKWNNIHHRNKCIQNVFKKIVTKTMFVLCLYFLIIFCELTQDFYTFKQIVHAKFKSLHRKLNCTLKMKIQLLMIQKSLKICNQFFTFTACDVVEHMAIFLVQMCFCKHFYVHISWKIKVINKPALNTLQLVRLTWFEPTFATTIKWNN